MDRAMAIAAETQRQSDAKIIEAQGNLRSAKLFRQSADELSKNDLSIQLHYFDTLKMIAAERNSTIIVPDSILSSLNLKKKKTSNA
jgi:regulator of protease activity HflC (stomatin/prohibitin superfamily)